MIKLFCIQIIDLRLQVDHVNPKKIQLHEENGDDPGNAHVISRTFAIKVRHKEIKKAWNGNKITDIKFIGNDNTQYGSFYEEMMFKR